MCKGDQVYLPYRYANQRVQLHCVLLACHLVSQPCLEAVLGDQMVDTLISTSSSSSSSSTSVTKESSQGRGYYVLGRQHQLKSHVNEAEKTDTGELGGVGGSRVRVIYSRC
jgi:hypothetical protein